MGDVWTPCPAIPGTITGAPSWSTLIHAQCYHCKQQHQAWVYAEAVDLISTAEPSMARSSCNCTHQCMHSRRLLQVVEESHIRKGTRCGAVHSLRLAMGSQLQGVIMVMKLVLWALNSSILMVMKQCQAVWADQHTAHEVQSRADL